MDLQNKSQRFFRLFVICTFFASLIAGNVYSLAEATSALPEVGGSYVESISNQKIDVDDDPIIPAMRTAQNFLVKYFTLNSLLNFFLSNSCHRFASIVNLSRPPPVHFAV